MLKHWAATASASLCRRLFAKPNQNDEVTTSFRRRDEWSSLFHGMGATARREGTPIPFYGPLL
jgi:hypothetical protein